MGRLNMALNRATLDLIKLSEGVRLLAYADPAHGWKVPTIGVGHTSAAGPPSVFRGQRITASEADAILARDLKAVEKAVRALVTVPLTANQLGALVSFTFNLGIGNLAKSGLLKRLNAKDYAGAAAQFARWKFAGGRVLPGLVKRRAAEARLFLTK
jgi:lysozyme